MSFRMPIATHLAAPVAYHAGLRSLEATGW